MLSRKCIGYQKLVWLAYHDSLTGLPNRNWLNEHIEDMPCQYVYFVDINDLHLINNNLGHTIGDRQICDVVAILKRKTVISIIRYAGDEFVVLSNRKGQFKTNAAFSVGEASMDEVGNNLAAAINRADQNMIFEKKRFKRGRS